MVSDEQQRSGASEQFGSILVGNEMSKPQITSVNTESIGHLTMLEVVERLQEARSQGCQEKHEKPVLQPVVRAKPQMSKFDAIPEHLF